MVPENQPSSAILKHRIEQQLRRGVVEIAPAARPSLLPILEMPLDRGERLQTEREAACKITTYWH